MAILAKTIDERAKEVANLAKDYKADPYAMDTKGTREVKETLADNIALDMESNIKWLERIRNGSPTEAGKKVSLSQFLQDRYNLTRESFNHIFGISPTITLESLYSKNDIPDGFRWIIPEIIQEEIEAGFLNLPMYQDIVAREISISQMQTTMPHVNYSNATPKKMGEAERFDVGTISFGQKSVRAYKYGIGFEGTYESLQFSTLDQLGIFLRDMGRRLAEALMIDAIDTLVSGDVTGNASTAAPVVGITTANTLTHKDFNRMWVRMSQLGKLPTGFLLNEKMTLDVLELPEFKGFDGLATKQGLTLSTNLPATQAVKTHFRIPNDSILFYDRTQALAKLNVGGLMVESERIVNKQVIGTYASVRTGFAKLFQDASVLLDTTVAYNETAGETGGFPVYMDPKSIVKPFRKDF